MARESAVVQKIRDWLLSQPFPVRVRKLADRYTRGLPDLQAFFRYQGHLILLEIEAKRTDGGRVSDIQRADAKACERVLNSPGDIPLPFPFGKYVRCVARSVDDVRRELATHGVLI